MSKKKNLKHESFSDVKISDADIKKYVKKHTVISKGKAIGSVIAGVALVGASAGAATYFALTRKSDSGGQIVEQTYTVTFNDQFEGSPKVINVKTLKDGLVEEPKINCHDGYGFAGWFKDSKCTHPFDFNEKITSNITLYGKWYEASEDGLVFDPIENAEGNVIGYSVGISDNETEAAKLPAHLVIPPTHGRDNLPVLEIKESGFKDTLVVTVSIPSTVTTINDNAFYDCGYLVRVQTSNSIKKIGESAFDNVQDLVSFTFDDCIEEIGDCAFNMTQLSKFKLGPSIKSLGSGLLSGNCLKEIDLSRCNKLKTIPAGFAEYCDSLTSIKLPESIETIDYDAFKFCSSLKEINIPESVKTIGSSAFYGCVELMSVNFPSNSKLIDIKESAFNMCLSLSEITIPKYVINIEQNVFYKCSNLKRVNFLNDFDTYYVSRYDDTYNLDIKDAKYDIKTSTPEQNASLLYNKDDDYGYSFIRNGKIDSESKLYYIQSGDNQVTINGRSDFTLEEIEIPLNIENMAVTSINEGAFNYEAEIAQTNDVTPIKKLVFEVDENDENNILKDIGSSAFNGQTLIEEIENLNYCVNLNTIGSFAFYKVGDDVEANSLVDLNLDLSETALTDIGMGAFDSAKLLKTIKLPSTLKSVGNFAFMNTKSLTSADFTLCTQLSDFGYTETIGGVTPLTRIGDGVFSNSAIESIDLSYTKIPYLYNYSFYCCSSLKTISLPSTLLAIGTQCFYNCDQLTEITIPLYVIKIELEAFTGCNNLTSVTVDSVIIAAQDNPGDLFSPLEGQNPKIVNIPHEVEVGSILSDTEKYSCSEGDDYDTYTENISR